MKIERVTAWEVLDSRGNPTVACEVTVDGGARGVASVPSGASTGTFEAHELRDGGDRYGGKGALRAVANVNGVLGPAIHGFDPSDQAGVDALLREIDGTPRLDRLGANALLAVSVAAALASAAARRLELFDTLGNEPLLPMPMVNIVSGGAHARGGVDIQDVLAVPVGASSFAEAIEWAARVRSATADVASERGLDVSLVADEGGLGPRLDNNRAALELVAAGVERSGLALGGDAALAVDLAANQFHADGRYRFDGRDLDAAAVVAEVVSWCDAFPIVSVEDPVADTDDDGWAIASRELGVQLLGDDLFCTDLARLEAGIASGTANAVLVKPNQTGTLTGARRVLERAKGAGYATVVSARSGETEDGWLADLAVGWAAGQIKVGSTMRSERTAKWNRLLRIEAQTGAPFAGWRGR